MKITPDGISDHPNFKNFLGGMPPDPPRMSCYTAVVFTSLVLSYRSCPPLSSSFLRPCIPSIPSILSTLDVCIVYSVYSVYVIYTIYSVYTVYFVYTHYSLYSVYLVYTVHFLTILLPFQANKLLLLNGSVFCSILDDPH